MSFDTVFPADTVEFCPQQPDVLVCGTYKLVEDEKNVHGTQQRVGQCLVFKVSDDHLEHPKLEKIQAIDLPAVLDMKWTHTVSSLLGIADSEGNVSLYDWNSTQASLSKKASVRCAPTGDILCLSLDWSHRRFPSVVPSLVVSMSNGSLCVAQQHLHSGLDGLRSWHAHDHEPWAASWDTWSTSTIYSGGDDLKLKAWDIRTDLAHPVWTHSRFEAGVTTIQSHPHEEHILGVGSYDNSVRLFDVRKMRQPLTRVDVGGGAWRVKWHPAPTRKADLLVACMHDGFKTVHFENMAWGEGGSSATIQRFDEHQSLAYGTDWSTLGSTSPSLIASCSFYDHTLHLWKG